MDWSKDWTKEENWHEYAKLLPLANKDDFARIVQGIGQKGLRHKIVLFEGKILDGRNRALACAENGITLTDNHFVQFDPNKEGISALEYVITENLEQRQLTWDQQCAVAAEIVPLLAEKAKQRQTDAGERGAEGGRGHKKPLAEKPAEGFEEFGKSAAQAASRFPGISTSAVERIVALEKAAPGTRDKIKHGQITIRQAEKEVENQKHPRQKLSAFFVAPPFSFLDPTADYWKDRKAEWASIFDPVLCECMIRWFAPTTGGHILDPFAGGSTRGIVAAHLGYQYTGIEWLPGQAEINARQAETVRVVHPSLHAPTWLQEWIQPGGPHLNLPEAAGYDMVFTSPPVYSGSQADISTWGTYQEFANWWASICGQAVARLKENRFAIVAVEELTDTDGIIRNFIEHNKALFEQLGLAYYNRMVLRTYPEMPKWTETEQQIFATFPACRAVEILCFWKGDVKELARLPRHIGAIQDARKTPIVNREAKPAAVRGAAAPSDTVEVKISAKSVRLLFHGCDPDYISNVCHGRCCENASAPGGTMIPVSALEGKALSEKFNATIKDGYLQPGSDRKCQFKAPNHLCQLHGTGLKPAGCIQSPFTLNPTDTLIVRNRYKLLNCHRRDGRIPAYEAFRSSLDLFFGKDEAARICGLLENGADAFTAQMPADIYHAHKDRNSRLTTSKKGTKRNGKVKSNP